MKRQVLTFDNNGVREDLIPYVDALAVVMEGSNLKETLDKIRDDVKRNNLFLGAFESELTLLASYPNGNTLEQGTYAIVTDVDAIYLYDVETLSWKKTATSSLAISQINGLTPVNGTLTITGGDINASVPNADITEQSITNHLNTLYDKANDNVNVSYGTIAYDYGYADTIMEGNYITFKARVYNSYKNSNFLFMRLRALSGITTNDYNKNVRIQIEYEDGETKTIDLYSADYSVITYRNLVDFLGVNLYNPYVLINTRSAVLVNLNKNMQDKNIITTYLINENKWIDNEEGTGYKYVITAGITSFTSSYNVLSVYKQFNNIKTTAIVDYTTEGNLITLYSDEKFVGGATITYVAG